MDIVWWNFNGVSSLAGVSVYLAGSCRARYGEMVQARLMWSFHCFSDMLLYLDLQFAMLVSSDGSVAIASSGVDSGLYHIVSRSISLACGETQQETDLIRLLPGQTLEFQPGVVHMKRK